jgi:nitrous oxidase accessory protein NosD
MKRKIAGLWITLLVILNIITIAIIIPMPVGAVMIYVDDDGGADYTTIQEAIDAANSGDQVFVYSGTYTEQIVVDKAIDLIGESANLVTIDGGGSGDTVQVTADWAYLGHSAGHCGLGLSDGPSYCQSFGQFRVRNQSGSK